MPRLVFLAAVLCGSLQAASAEQLSDPTRPYSARTPVRAATASFSLSAVFVSQDRRVAIVNGRRVAVGDQVDGATVVEIFPDRVRLSHQGEEVVTRLLSATSRK